jgi:hypothetical protein
MRDGDSYPEKPDGVKRFQTQFSGSVRVGDAQVVMESGSLEALIFCIGLALRGKKPILATREAQYGRQP